MTAIMTDNDVNVITVQRYIPGKKDVGIINNMSRFAPLKTQSVSTDDCLIILYLNQVN